MKHWLQLVAIPGLNCLFRQARASSAEKTFYRSREGKIALSPRRGSQSKQSTQLALPGPSAPAKGVKGGKGSKKGKKG